MAKNYKLVTIEEEFVSVLLEIAPTCNQAIKILLEDKRLANTMESASQVKGTLQWKKNKK